MAGRALEDHRAVTRIDHEEVQRLRDGGIAELSVAYRQHHLQPGFARRLAQMSLSASTLSRNLQPLVVAGWVSIGPGAEARSRRIEATEAGRAKRAEARRRWKAAQEHVNRSSGSACVQRLHGALDAAMPGLNA